MTNHIGDFEKAVEKCEQAFDELDKALHDLRIFLKKWRKQCLKNGKKKLSS